MARRPSRSAHFQHSLPIPNSPALKGLQLVLQTFSFTADQLTNTLELSNGLHWAVGHSNQGLRRWGGIDFGSM